MNVVVVARLLCGPSCNCGQLLIHNNCTLQASEQYAVSGTRACKQNSACVHKIVFARARNACVFKVPCIKAPTFNPMAFLNNGIPTQAT